MVKDIPVIFSAPMIEALLAGRKTMTRRLRWTGRKAADGEGFHESPWARVKPGDRLWTRENHFRWGQWDYQPDRDRKWMFLPAGGDDFHFPEEMDDGYESPKRTPGRLAWYLRPSIFQPREHSRLTLTVTATRAERLQAMREADCIAEGCEIIRLGGNPVDDGPMVRLGPSHVYGTPRTWFRELWCSLHGAGAWDGNPEVVALTFTVHKQNIDALPKAA